MHLLSTTLLLPLLTTAHFVMHYPTSRNGDDDEIEVNSPCSGKPVSDNRTTVSLPTFPIALEMGHEETVIQILLSLSDNPTEDDFNITLERTFQQDGLGEFCLPNVRVPESANVKAGDKATVQVVTDGEGGGGLYVCADVVFTDSQQALPSSCSNNTGVTASVLPADDNINANMSDATGGAQSGSASASATGSEASSTSSGSGAVQTAMVAGWGMIGAGVMGAVALL